MQLIAQALSDLGFEKVVGIVDNDKAVLVEKLESAFPKFRFFSIPADDVRTKKARAATPPKAGLLDDKNTRVRSEHRSKTKRLLDEINRFLSVPSA